MLASGSRIVPKYQRALPCVCSDVEKAPIVGKQNFLCKFCTGVHSDTAVQMRGQANRIVAAVEVLDLKGTQPKGRGLAKTPKPAGGLDRCLLIRFLRVISVVEHRKPTETVEAEIQPSDGFPYRHTESRVVPHLLSWHSGGRPLFELSYFSSTAAATTLS